jgi:nucleoside-diphosphate-sugar epimerase
MEDRIVLVTGATGALGPRVVQAFSALGYRVRTLSSGRPTPGLFPSSVEVVTGDVTNKEAVAAATTECDVLVHLAARLHIVDPPPAVREEYERINVLGTASVVSAAIALGVRRVVYFSTVAVYGPAGGRLLTETLPLNPDTLYGETKLAAERLVLAARGLDGSAIGTALRFGAVYGPRLRGNYRRLLFALRDRRFVGLGSGSNRRPLIYDADAARAAIVATEHPTGPGQVFNVTDGAFHSVKEIVSAMCLALGRRPPRFSVPAAPVRLAVGLIERVARMVHVKPPITRSAIDKFTEDVAVDGGRFQRQLGFRAGYNLETGWKETVAEMRRTGEL